MPDVDPLIRHVADKSINRLAKWRSIYAGWQLGTRMRGGGEVEAVRDHREATLLLRAEVSALVALLIEKNAFTIEEWTRHVGQEAEYLSKALEKKFPGAHAVDDGMSIDTEEFRKTTERLGFPK